MENRLELSQDGIYTFFFLDEKEAKSQESSDGISHNATLRRGLSGSRATSEGVLSKEVN